MQLLGFLSFRVTLYTLQLVFFIAFLRLSVLFTCILLFTAFLPFPCFLLCGDEACQRRLVTAWPEKSAALTWMD